MLEIRCAKRSEKSLGRKITDCRILSYIGKTIGAETDLLDPRQIFLPTTVARHPGQGVFAGRD